MPRALITGGTGFVGKHLSLLLGTKGFSVAVLTREPHSDSEIDYYQGDIRDATCIHSAVREIRPEWVFHLAGISAIDAAAADPQLTYEINVGGARNLFAAVKAFSDQTRVLNVSTSQVYAPSNDALTESSVTEPVGPYATSKAMAEAIAAQYPGIITVRPFNHTGPGQPANFVLSSIAKQIAEIESNRRSPTLSLGNVHVKRDFTDVRDVVRAYWLVLDKGKPGETYNVCSGDALSISDIVELFSSISGMNVAVESTPAKIRHGEAAQLKGDAGKILCDTGWKPTIELRTTVRDLLDYWRSEFQKEGAHNSYASTR
jgi:GDP-4-dehydro-6-deoxy-D-mannose reductase